MHSNGWGRTLPILEQEVTMQVHLRLPIGVATALLLSVMTATATANRLELPNGDDGFVLMWSPLSFEAAGRAVRCDATLVGSFHSTTFAKEEGALLGHVTHASLGECSGGSATLLDETLPWHLTYEDFAGTLPSITEVSLSLIDMSAQVSVEGITCLANGDSSDPVELTMTTEQWEEELEREGSGFIVPTATADESATIPLSGSFPCTMLTASLAGTASITTAAEEPARLRLALVESTPARADLGPRETVVDFDPFGTSVEHAIFNTAPLGSQRLFVNEIGLSNAAVFDVRDPNGCTNQAIVPRRWCVFDVAYVGPDPDGTPVSTTVTAYTSVEDPTARVTVR